MLIISGCVLTEELVEAVKQWLCIHIPEFSNFKICSSGKYLGWHLGVDSNVLSFRDPLAKFGKRVVGISEAKAPATISMLRYNERAIPVLSYVAQFATPPASINIRSKEFYALHKLLRLPPCSLTHAFLHSLSLFTIVEPTPIEDYCSAIMYRFALSEAPYFATLASSIKLLIGESMPIACASNVCVFPMGVSTALPFCNLSLMLCAFRGYTIS